jgi:hypothetical protein
VVRRVLRTGLPEDFVRRAILGTGCFSVYDRVPGGRSDFPHRFEQLGLRKIFAAPQPATGLKFRFL